MLISWWSMLQLLLLHSLWRTKLRRRWMSKHLIWCSILIVLRNWTTWWHYRSSILIHWILLLLMPRTWSSRLRWLSSLHRSIIGMYSRCKFSRHCRSSFIMLHLYHTWHLIWKWILVVIRHPLAIRVIHCRVIWLLAKHRRLWWNLLVVCCTWAGMHLPTLTTIRLRIMTKLRIVLSIFWVIMIKSLLLHLL